MLAAERAQAKAAAAAAAVTKLEKQLKAQTAVRLCPPGFKTRQPHSRPFVCLLCIFALNIIAKQSVLPSFANGYIAH